MSSRSRKDTRSRQPKEVRLALGITVIWVVIIIFFAAEFKLNGRTDPIYVITFGLAAALAWIWAIRSIRARNAVGKTLEEIRALSPDQFEEWVGARFRDLGYSVRLTGTSGDHGVDLIAEKQDEVAVIQCKNYRVWSVGEPVLRDLFGAMHDFGAKRAYLVTSGRLTRAATDWVTGKPIDIWDGEFLARLSLRSAPKVNQTANQIDTQKENLEAIILSKSTAIGPACPKCGSTLVERRNRSTGESFLACPNYSKCRHTQPIGG